MPMELIYDADNMLRLEGLVDKSGPPGSTPIPVGTATLTGNILDSDGTVIIGPLTLTQIGATNDYEILVDRAASLTVNPNQTYEVTVDADDGADRTRLFRDDVLVKRG